MRAIHCGHAVTHSGRRTSAAKPDEVAARLDTMFAALHQQGLFDGAAVIGRGERVMEMHTMLWRRLDVPGHDACILEINETGARLRGSAVFLHEGEPAQLHYEVHCDREWRCERGAVSGFIGSAAIARSFLRAGGWMIDGRLVRGLEHCVDLDFGFTPATNVFPLRRLALAPGESAEAPAAWFDVDALELMALPQRYERRTESIWWYESPTAGYAAELEVGASGFTRHYPDLWIAER